jgi:hypothetical protein
MMSGERNMSARRLFIIVVYWKSHRLLAVKGHRRMLRMALLMLVPPTVLFLAGLLIP